MHNTSSQLYKYISDLIIEFFTEQRIQSGDRYNFYLEDENQMSLLFNSLSENSISFSYIHPDGGEEYSTSSLIIGDVQVIIASSLKASEDYLTMLRNKVAEQSDKFDNTAILILFSGKLDSLLGGSSSLSKEGMPLHHSVFKKRIEKDIDQNDSLLEYEKAILKFVSERKTKSVVEDNNSIFDYEFIINVLTKKTFKKEDFNSLGLFSHEELRTKKNEALVKDLNGNFNLYERYEKIFLNGDPTIELDQELPDTAIKTLVSEGWNSCDYSQLVKWMESEKEKTPPNFQSITGDNLLQTFWYKADGDSTSKKRNINLIVFNPSLELPFKLNAKYDQFIKKEGLRVRSGSENIKVTNSGYNIVIEFVKFNPESLFSLIEYKDSETDKKYLIKILYLPFKENVISEFEGNFQLKISKTSSYLQIKETPILIFNPEGNIQSNQILSLDKTVKVNADEKLVLDYDPSLSQEDVILFKIDFSDVKIPIALKTDFELPKLISGLEVWKEKRINKTSFKYLQEGDTIKLLFKNNERTIREEFRVNLIHEYYIINSDSYSWELGYDNEISDRDLELSDDIKFTFNNLRNYYRSKQAQPSLVYFSEDLKQISLEYINCFIRQLEQFEENKSLKPAQKNLLWLGVVKENVGEEKIKLSPLHPINVAYQLQLNNDLEDEDIYDAILKRLNPYNLIPYIEGKPNEVYIPIDSNHSPEWLYYSIYLNSKQAVPKNYVSNLVADKIKDFTTNFDFIFNQSVKSPVKINIVNLGDCKEVVEGIFEYYRKYLNNNINKKISDLYPIEVNIYGSHKIVTKFEELTFYENVEDVEKHLRIDLKSKNFEKDDLLNAFFDQVKFYSKNEPQKNENYEYAHITFYQFDVTKTERSYDDLSLVKTGVSFNGLMADVVSTPTVENYRTGFGTLDLPENPNQLTRLASLYNAFVRVANNGDPYEKSKALCTSINYDVKESLEKLYKSSQWVTYIDPKVDLDFFKESKDLVIIHYSDQYNNSNGYDAITVSQKTDQYEVVVKEFLQKHHVQFETNDKNSIINFFNAINGEWLLKLIRQSSQFPREKLSLLSGIKSTLSILYHPNIIWVPISLEEILRVSGNAGLNMGDGLFSTKNLGANGSFSDDLLFIGLEKDNDQLLMHLYPVELKIGNNSIVKKGVEQGERTASLLREHLSKEGFLSEFYKNFFAKIVLTNAEKMQLFNVWDHQDWCIISNDYRKDLLNNNFIINNRLDLMIGSFGLIHFAKDKFSRKISTNDHYMHVELLETDGYEFLVKSVDDLIQFFHNTETTINKDCLLINAFEQTTSDPDPVILSELNNEVINNNLETEPSQEIEKKKVTSNTAEGIKIEFGTNLNNSKKVFWEPNNTNKVMHTNTGIIGTMGTGKTQFTKSLITQLNANADKNIGNERLGILIFDYKGDYIKDDFVNKTNAKVLHPYHLPYNPLALDADEKSKPMLPLHTANDLKETISNAFNLGNVQKQRLRDVIVEAYESKGIFKADRTSWTQAPPTLGDVCDVYLSHENNSQDSLYAAISNLSEFEIFEPDTAKTKSLYSLIEGIVVINLSGYDESIQNLIVAITLDAFYTQMQHHGHSIINGSDREIRKMILVDEADNFLSKNFNSIRKILKEGREFGVGTILSTQFLNHFATGENEYSNYILTWVIHRVNEIKMKEVESLFSLDNKIQKENLIKTIKDLEKHQSIVNLAGSEPILIRDKAFWEL
ncbi:DNA phosphorothioation-dependent restriction protein DptH [Chryseobacterium sp. R2ACT005]|uniref:DNA phosphorothioation-dependent restriction protein DptH n=1 Tax=Chryseobacterium sp. R2ACT005 TaxID=3416668 RepID=UPI003CF1CAF1